jgi:hypothetical protein
MKSLLSSAILGLLLVSVAHAGCQDAYMRGHERALGLDLSDKTKGPGMLKFFKGIDDVNSGVGMFTLGLIGMFAGLTSPIAEAQALRDEEFFKAMAELLSNDPGNHQKAEKKVFASVQDKKVTKDKLSSFHDEFDAIKTNDKIMCPEKAQLVLSAEGEAAIRPYTSVVAFAEKGAAEKVSAFFATESNFEIKRLPMAMNRLGLRSALQEAASDTK